MSKTDASIEEDIEESRKKWENRFQDVVAKQLEPENLKKFVAEHEATRDSLWAEVEKKVAKNCVGEVFSRKTSELYKDKHFPDRKRKTEDDQEQTDSKKNHEWNSYLRSKFRLSVVGRYTMDCFGIVRNICSSHST